ncbi:hypothetical protein [Microbispora bryophytorum]|uniref:hypothetical protein n=1 Tax=Microbispora bryophytorum TaxID=1460882 RepID=UPI0033D91F10
MTATAVPRRRTGGKISSGLLVDYTVPDRKGDHIRLITTILDPAEATAQQLAARYHERWEAETGFAQLRPLSRLRHTRPQIRGIASFAMARLNWRSHPDDHRLVRVEVAPEAGVLPQPVLLITAQLGRSACRTAMLPANDGYRFSVYWAGQEGVGCNYTRLSWK